MYSKHFGLNQDPFSIAPDPRYLFMSDRHREALAHLLYGVTGPEGHAGGSGGGFVLLTGDIGTGKTTVCRCFLEQIPSGCHVAYIFNPKLTVLELLESIGEEFHIAPPGPDAHLGLPPLTPKAHIDALNAFLLRSHAAGNSCVLVIDEAQNLSPDVLEQLRLLTNLETSERKLLQIVLIGQPELRAMLARPELEQLAQRVIARFHLDALNEAETAQYIAHRLAVAGHRGPLPFDRRALQRIHRLSRGVPRRINLLCGRAMLGAWTLGRHQVTARVVTQAAAEVFDTGPLPASAAGASPRWPALAGWSLAVVLGVALAAGVWSGRVTWPPAGDTTVAAAEPPAAASPPPVTTPEETAAVAATAASGTDTLPHPVPPPLTDMDELLSRVSPDLRVAWQALGLHWQLPTTAADPCQSASGHGVLCHQATGMTVPQLRQLGRLGILTLQLGQEAPRYAVLVGLGEQTATLEVQGQRYTVLLVSLVRLWRGDLATYWRPPAGYQERLDSGSAGPAVTHLARRLDTLDGTPPAAEGAPAPVLDAALRARVRAFQRAHGLTPDGQPGPMTFMQLDSVTGTEDPRLSIE